MDGWDEGVGTGESSGLLAEDEEEAREEAPAAGGERAAAAEAAAGDHGHGLPDQQQGERADAVPGRRVRAVHAELPPGPVHAHVRRAPAALGADGEDEGEDVEEEHQADHHDGRHQSRPVKT